MLLMLGGFPGSGRRRLARELETSYGYFRYDLDAKKLKRFVSARGGGVREISVMPESDLVRTFLYRQVIDDMPFLSKMYERVLIDDTFPYASTRIPLEKAAENHFDPVVRIWVETSEDDARVIMAEMVRNRSLYSIEQGMRRRERARSIFEPFDPPIPIFRYVPGERDAAARFQSLVESIESELKRSRSAVRNILPG